MFFDRHEMGRPMTGGQRRIDVIANQNDGCWGRAWLSKQFNIDLFPRATHSDVVT
jgi:hypothetical protein